MRYLRILLLISVVLPVFSACVKDLESEGIASTTEYVGIVVEKSTNAPVQNIVVKVTDGTHIHAQGTTDYRGKFVIPKVDFEAVSKSYYLWLDGSKANLPSKQEPLKGLGKRKYDYGSIVLYDKSNASILPRVNTDLVTNVKAVSATVQGNVTFDGGYAVSERGVCYGTSQTPTVNDTKVTAGSGVGQFTCNLSALVRSKQYYVRTYAINSIGITYGEQKTFTTKSGLASVTTKDATNVTSSEAQLNGSVNDDGGTNIIERGFCWGETANPVYTGQHFAMPNNGTGSIELIVTNFQPNSTWYFRAYARTQYGVSYGANKFFTTLSGMPTVSTNNVSNITATSAQCGGLISDNGGFDIIARGVCWNTTGNPTVNASHTSDGVGDGSFVSQITNLAAGTTYHVRAYAINITGTAYGPEKTFTTSSGQVVMTTSTASSITAASAICGGNITDDGGYPITEHGVCWSTTTNPVATGSHLVIGTGMGTFSGTITGLTNSRTYYVRAYAKNSAGTFYGNQISFTTKSGKPTVTTTSATNITATSITAGGNVTADGGYSVTEKGLCYSTSPSPTISDSKKILGTGVGSFSGSITGLSVNTLYYIRAYATNSKGTSYGTEITATTASGLPTVTTTNITNVTATSAQTGGNVTSDGGYPVTARGVCYGTLPNPDLTSNYSHTTNGTGTGYFSSTISLSGSGTYYVRAYATNANGTVYGTQKTCTYTNPYDTLPTFTYGGHTYKVAPDPGNTMTWSVANSYCNGLTLYGYSDWRLPTKQELMQMYTDRNTIHGFTSNCYWSSSSSGDFYYCVDFSNGYLDTWRGSSYTFRVRPIRVAD
ncbi:MAG: DUF1566 domain-containing protein [Bacteroidales bacterium]|nr:DUF1566 domain-containing protein [Bacteroidales bacterium]